MATATDKAAMMVRMDSKADMLPPKISHFKAFTSGYPSRDQSCPLSALPWISRYSCADNIFGLDFQGSGFRPEETALVSLKTKPEHKFNLTYCVA